MLVVLGGFLGSGRKLLAERLGENGFHRCDPNDYKMRTYGFTPEGGSEEKLVHPWNDDVRTQLYAKVLRDFPLLSKMHERVVFDEQFTRLKPREYFFVQAARHFKDLRFFWIDCDEAAAQTRLAKMVAQGRYATLEAARAQRERMQREFEPFTIPPATLVCNSDQDIEDAMRRIMRTSSQ